MTIKPKAKKFRVRRSALLPDDGNNAARKAAADAAAKNLQAKKSNDAKVSAEARSIPISELSARQLRMAGRLAERKGLTVATDSEAVQALRDRGIDPFTQNRLAIVPKQKPRTEPEVPVPPPTERTRPQNPDQQLPAKATPVTVPTKKKAPKVPGPSMPAAAEEQRAAQILKLQKEIASRRKRKLLSLWGRLSAFVLAPTFAAFYYFSSIASPLYSTYSDFIIQQSDNPAAGGMGGLFSGTSLANSQDSITVQSYLTSRGAMLRLEEDIGFREFYASEDIDRLQRLDPDASNERVFRQYKKSIKIGYDPTEGLVRMEVVAPDPEIGLKISNALLEYAEDEVDSLNQPIRRDQMSGAEQSLADAEDNMRAAQKRVLDLQEARGVLSAEAEITSLMSQISTFEVMLKEEELRLRALMDNTRPNQTKVDVSKREIARLETLISEMRSELTQDQAGKSSLARITGELVLAEAELETRQMMLSQALQQLETARIEANRQVRYLLQGVRPTLTDEPSYPKVFENTVLAFLVFAGIYLMISLTLSVLREQVSS